MTDDRGLTPPSASDEPASPPWGAPPAPPAYSVPASLLQVTGQQTHQGGLWSMILGIVGLVSAVLSIPTSGVTAVGMVCSPVAFGLGIWSSRVIRDRPDVYNNRGHAIAGWVLGLIGMLLAVVGVLVVLAFVVLVLWVFAETEQSS